jgi:hypothetical protein
MPLVLALGGHWVNSRPGVVRDEQLCGTQYTSVWLACVLRCEGVLLHACRCAVACMQVCCCMRLTAWLGSVAAGMCVLAA